MPIHYLGRLGRRKAKVPAALEGTTRIDDVESHGHALYRTGVRYIGFLDCPLMALHKRRLREHGERNISLGDVDSLAAFFAVIDYTLTHDRGRRL